MRRTLTHKQSLKGRGALSNPPGRFDLRQLAAVDDGWYTEESPDSIETTLEPDRAREIISTNDSPDIPFEYSINPYRGCSHGCVYCLRGDTAILMADHTTRELARLRVGDHIYGTVHEGDRRRYVPTQVLAHWSVIKAANRVRLANGTELTAGPEHRFLTEAGWRFVTAGDDAVGARPHLRIGDRLMGDAAGFTRRQDPHASLLFEDAQIAARADGMNFARAQQHRVRGREICANAVITDARLSVIGLEPVRGALRLYDITTGTGDFVANGVVSHNCYARPSHAYMGLSPGLDFETRLFYKADAAAVLEKQLARPGYVCKPIMLGANTDPYQPDERHMQVTRSILQVLLRVRHPVSVITKSALVLRDLDLLGELARQGLTSVAVSVTTLDSDLKRTLEPRTAAPLSRLRTLRELHAAGVPTTVMVAPVIPALNDHEIESILEASAHVGASRAAYVLLRLPYEIKDLFREWLEAHYPQRAAHVMSLIRDMRGGRDNDPRFGTRMRGTGPYAHLLRHRFEVACRRLNLNAIPREALNTTSFCPPTARSTQLHLGL